MNKRLKVVGDQKLHEVEVKTVLVMRVWAEDVEDAKSKSAHMRLWLNETKESREWLDCVAWGPEDVNVWEVA